MLQHILTQHFFWFVAQDLFHCGTEVSEAALMIGGKDDLRHVLHQLAILEFGVTQRLGRLFLAALGKQDSRAGAEQRSQDPEQRQKGRLRYQAGDRDQHQHRACHRHDLQQDAAALLLQMQEAELFLVIRAPGYRYQNERDARRRPQQVHPGSSADHPPGLGI